MFVSALSGQKDTASWLLVDDGQPYHTHAGLIRVETEEIHVEPEDDEEQAPEATPFFAVELTTHRSQVEEGVASSEETATHTDFFHALGKALADTENLHVSAWVDMYYDSEDARWRVSLLASPPEFGEFDTELGRISLAGLTLRFNDSAAGLYNVSLDTSPLEDEFRAVISFVLDVSPGEVDEVYARVVEQAEEFASLFISTRG